MIAVFSVILFKGVTKHLGDMVYIHQTRRQKLRLVMRNRGGSISRKTRGGVDQSASAVSMLLWFFCVLASSIWAVII